MDPYNKFISSNTRSLDQLRNCLGDNVILYFGNRLGNISINLNKNKKVPIDGIDAGLNRYEPQFFNVRIDLDDMILQIYAGPKLVVSMNFDSYYKIDKS